MATPDDPSRASSAASRRRVARWLSGLGDPYRTLMTGRPFPTPSLCPEMHASAMNSLSTLAAGGGGDLLVGILIGCCLGILIGPGFRAWQTHREWVDASREAQLVDHLLSGLEADADPEADVWTALRDGAAHRPNGHQTQRAWRTSLKRVFVGRAFASHRLEHHPPPQGAGPPGLRVRRAVVDGVRDRGDDARPVTAGAGALAFVLPIAIAIAIADRDRRHLLPADRPRLSERRRWLYIVGTTTWGRSGAGRRRRLDVRLRDDGGRLDRGRFLAITSAFPARTSTR